jgi:hypothetical protein
VGVAVRCLHCSSEAWDVEEHGFSRFLAQHDHSDDVDEIAPVVPIAVKNAMPYPRSDGHDSAGSVLLLPLHDLAGDAR